jgi:hypothetical protein
MYGFRRSNNIGGIMLIEGKDYDLVMADERGTAGGYIWKKA